MVIFDVEGTHRKMDMPLFSPLLSIQVKSVLCSHRKHLIRTDQMSKFCLRHLAMTS